MPTCRPRSRRSAGSAARPPARARSRPPTCPRRSSGGIHSGSSSHGSTSWATRTSSGTQCRRASLPVASTAASSTSRMVVRPGGAVPLKAPATRRSARSTIQPARSRASTSWTGALGVARGDHVAAGRDPLHPPGQAEDVVVRPADQPRAHAGDAIGHGGLRGALAGRLQRAIVVALGPHRAVLVDRLGRPRGVDVAGRDEDQMAEVERAGARHVGGLVAARVDRRVP